MKKTKDDKALRIEIKKILKKFGIQECRTGYPYIIELIVLAVHDELIPKTMTKRGYPAVGKKFNKTATSVDRAARLAIRGGLDLLPPKKRQSALENIGIYDNRIPVVSEFVFAISGTMKDKGYGNTY